jgi:amidase
MTRTVSMRRRCSSAMVGRDDNDAATANSVGKAVFDYARAWIRMRCRARASACCARTWAGIPMSTRRWNARSRTLKSAGAEVVDADIPTKGKWDDPEFEVLLFEFKAGVEHYLQTHDVAPKTLAQLIEFNKRTSAKEMPYFGRRSSRRRMRRARSAIRRTSKRARRRAASQAPKASMRR